MNISIDGSKVLYIVGALLGVVTLGYFGFEFLTGLSPTVIAALLALTFIGLLSAALTIDRGGLEVVTYALSAGSYLVWLTYVLTQFDLGETGVLLALLFSSVLFVGLGYSVREIGLSLDRSHAIRIVAVLVVVAVLLVTVDVVGADLTYQVETEDAIEVPEPREQTQIGTVTVENEFILSRSIDSVVIGICLTGPEPREFTDRPIRDDVIAGGESETGEITVFGGLFYDGEELREPFSDLDSIPIDQSDGSECPTDDEVRLVVLTGELDV